MWTSKNRARYDRSKLRYPSDLTDDEWNLVEPLIPPGKSGGGKRTVIMREVVNGLMYHHLAGLADITAAAISGDGDQRTCKAQLPQNHQRDGGSLQLPRKRRPIRLRPSPLTQGHAGPLKQPAFEFVIRQVGRQRPAQARRRRALEIVLDRAARRPKAARNLPRPHPIVMQPQHLPKLSHGQLSPCRHPLSSLSRRDECAESLTRRTRPPDLLAPPGGRLQIGMVADINSETWPASNRYARPASVGIRKLGSLGSVRVAP